MQHSKNPIDGVVTKKQTDSAQEFTDLGNNIQCAREQSSTGKNKGVAIKKNHANWLWDACVQSLACEN